MMGVVLVAAVVDAVALALIAVLWHFFGGRLRAFFRAHDLQEIARRLWNERLSPR
jgi:hypothetical protein